MVNIYTGSNTTIPIGMVQDYNNTNASAAVKMYRTLATSPNPSTFHAEKMHTDFAQAIYGNGPYNLLRPNNTTETRALNIDYVA